jgi:hypothetical protein
VFSKGSFFVKIYNTKLPRILLSQNPRIKGYCLLKFGDIWKIGMERLNFLKENI